MTESPMSADHFRLKFLDKFQQEIKDFHPKDLLRINTDDEWLRRFLVHHNNVVEDAMNMLLETCQWRKTNKVNEISEYSVNREYLEEGSLFIHNKDRDGKPLLIFKCSKHVKGQKNFEELKKCVIYWFERAERCENANQITIFFDMTDTGLGNMDMDYTKYLINLCKLYYPNFLNYILIFEMPWILNTAFKIIKSWLPTSAVQKIKFLSKSSLDEYVDKCQALVNWGGTDQYTFTLVPMDQVKEDIKKKVHFADGSLLVDSTPGGFGDVSMDEQKKPTRLCIVPSDVVTFRLEYTELNGTIKIKNITDSSITYKIKTTSPEKFKVRPSLGSIPAGDTMKIDIVLLPGYTPSSIPRDKFLVLNLPLDTDTKNLNDYWKEQDPKLQEEHILRCKVEAMTKSHNGNPSSALISDDFPSPSRTDLEEKIAQLLISDHLHRVHAHSRRLYEKVYKIYYKKKYHGIRDNTTLLVSSMNHITECCCQLKTDIGFLQKLVIYLFILVIFLTCFTVFFGILLYH